MILSFDENSISTLKSQKFYRYEPEDDPEAGRETEVDIHFHQSALQNPEDDDSRKRWSAH